MSVERSHDARLRQVPANCVRPAIRSRRGGRKYAVVPRLLPQAHHGFSWGGNRRVIDDPSPRVAADRPQLESGISSDIRTMTASSDRIARLFAGLHGISNNDLDALLHIIVADLAGEPLTSGELGERLRVTAAAVTYLVDRMIESGHLRRETHPRDRRKVILRYSDSGLEVAHQFFGPLGDCTRAAMAHLPDEDLAAARRVFAALNGAMLAFRENFSPPP